MKISILLPYKENFSPEYPGAVSLFVYETSKISKYKNNITVFGNTDYKKIDFKKRCAIVMGPEKSSINNQFIKKSDKLLSIPIHGKVDSLNLSVATAIILYEALNQRKFS